MAHLFVSRSEIDVDPVSTREEGAASVSVCTWEEGMILALFVLLRQENKFS